MITNHSSPIPIYTVGYGSRSIEELIEVLQQYGIRWVVDVRTAPYSRYKPEFSKDALQHVLEAAGFRYLFMGDSLGGRPNDPSCYDDEGRVTYEKVETREFYQSGIERIKDAFKQQQSIVLMCSEGRPQECHRSKLIGVSLHDADIPVAHIDENNDIITQEDVMIIVQPQPSLFEEFDTLTSRKKYAPVDPPPDDADYFAS